jgi:hypothetical protein
MKNDELGKALEAAGAIANKELQRRTVRERTFYDVDKNKLALAYLTSYKSVFSFFQLFC